MKGITEQPSGRTRLLSFDGGGIRGLFALQYAKRMESLLRERAGKPDLVLTYFLRNFVVEYDGQPATLGTAEPKFFPPEVVNIEHFDDE